MRRCESAWSICWYPRNISSARRWRCCAAPSKRAKRPWPPRCAGAGRWSGWRWSDSAPGGAWFWTRPASGPRSESTPEDYPAPFRAIEAVEAALTQPLAQGLDFEARLVGELVPTRTSKNLIWLFQNRTALKGDLGGARAAPRQVRRLAVIGAGVMGGGIAHLAADRGIPVRLKDLRYEAILAALRSAREVRTGKPGREIPVPGESRKRPSWIAPTLDDTGLSGVDMVIEAVDENLEMQATGPRRGRAADRR